MHRKHIYMDIFSSLKCDFPCDNYISNTDLCIFVGNRFPSKWEIYNNLNSEETIDKHKNYAKL